MKCTRTVHYTSYEAPHEMRTYYTLYKLWSSSWNAHVLYTIQVMKLLMKCTRTVHYTSYEAPHEMHTYYTLYKLWSSSWNAHVLYTIQVMKLLMKCTCTIHYTSYEAPHEMHMYYTLSQKCDTVLVNILTAATKQIVFRKTVGARTASVTSSWCYQRFANALSCLSVAHTEATHHTRNVTVTFWNKEHSV